MALAQHAAALDALVRAGRRIRLGDRQFERPYADLEQLLADLDALVARMRVEAVAVQTIAVTGRSQILRSVARSAPAAPDCPRPGLRLLKAIPGGKA